MDIFKLFLPCLLIAILLGCKATAPDFSGQWEQIEHDQAKTTKRFLTITSEDNAYQILDEFKDQSTGEVSYDERSTGHVDGVELLIGTNNLTNVLNIDPKSQLLIMKTYDETTLKFSKIN